jgi:hypothetical protein
MKQLRLMYAEAGGNNVWYDKQAKGWRLRCHRGKGQQYNDGTFETKEEAKQRLIYYLKKCEE